MKKTEGKMKGFLNNILSSSIGFVLGVFMFFGSIFIFAIVIALIGSIFDTSGKIEPKTILKMKFNYTISDKPNTDPFLISALNPPFSLVLPRFI